MLTLREISSQDEYETFRALLLEYGHSDLADPQHSSIWKDIDNLPGRYAAPTGCVLFAQWNGQLAGCGAFAPAAPEGMAEIKRVYVRKDYRRLGIARRVTEELIVRARSAGYRTAAISTWDDNSQALALYYQMGFEPVPKFKEHASMHLVYLGLALNKPVSHGSQTGTNTLTTQ